MRLTPLSGLILLCSSLLGCLSQQDRLELHGHRLPLPTKDEIALVGDNVLSLSTYFSIRSQLKNSTRESAYWVGVGALLLQQKNLSQGKILPGETAIEIARYALQDLDDETISENSKAYLSEAGNKQKTPGLANQLKNEIDKMIQEAQIIKNDRLISLF